MSFADTATDVDRLLDAADEAIGKQRYCWLITGAGEGVARARPMGRVPRDAGEDRWMLRFLTDGRSPKAADMRRSAGVSVLFHNEDDEAYVALAGKACLAEGKAEILRRWIPAYDACFPEGPEQSAAIFVTVEVDRLELWIRGATREPFGLRTTVIERGGARGWRVTPC